MEKNIMSRKIRIVTIQPSAPDAIWTAEKIKIRTMKLLLEAAQTGPDFMCLPECLNIMGVDPADKTAVESVQSAWLDPVAGVARKFKTNIICPVIAARNGQIHNSAYLFNRSGMVVGIYDKVHCPETEQNDWQVVAGGEWPVFDCDVARVGIMICYDGCFTEPARILALSGAEIVFWPSLQRSYTDNVLELQIRSHAMFNFIPVVRSSYGTARNQPWQPGKMPGMSCICGADGTILASLGHWVGWTEATIDLDEPILGARSFGGQIGEVKKMRLGDRQPHTYQKLLAR
jgi:predicted amidohydrolase